jgi:hypothetical protein
MLGSLFKLVVIDEAHMMFDGGRGCLVNEIICLARCLGIPLLLLTGTVTRAEWRHLTLRLLYRPYWYPCTKNGHESGSIGYSLPENPNYTELQGSRKRKFFQLRRQVTTPTWDFYLDFLDGHALTTDDIYGVILFSHTKASVEDLFCKYVARVSGNDALTKKIRMLNDLRPEDCPEHVADPSYTLDQLQHFALLGHRYRIAYNHSTVGANYSELVGSQVTAAHDGYYRVIFCTSTYAAGVNLRNFTHVFIDGNQERIAGTLGRKYRPSELAQMAGRGARWSRGLLFTLGFKFDEQFEQEYSLPPVDEKTPSGYRLTRSDTPTVTETIRHIIEVVARYVGRSVRTVLVTFVDSVIRYLICGHKAFFILPPERQRYHVAVAGARMFNISNEPISAISLTGDVKDRTKPDVAGV